LDAQFQHGHLCLWALVDTRNKPERYTVRVIGTGQDASALGGFAHVGTVQANEGNIVLHVFVSLCGLPV
jgi:hypothetical protein